MKLRALAVNKLHIFVRNPHAVVINVTVRDSVQVRISGPKVKKKQNEALWTLPYKGRLFIFSTLFFNYFNIDIML